MKEQEGLINYLTNIIIRPHREIYGIQKLGPSKIVVKSNEKSISLLQVMSKNQKNFPKQLQKNYCELIEVNRRQVTIKSQGKNIQASIYEPQLTNISKNNSGNFISGETVKQKVSKQFSTKQNSAQQGPQYQNCVVLLHANSGSRLQGIEYTKQVLQYRTLCVSFDYTGSGISQGNYTTMGINQSKNLSAVMQFINEKYKVKKFSLWGRSMGAVTGIYYLLTKYKQDCTKIKVTSCVLDSPFCNLQRLILELASKKSNLPQFVFQPILKSIQKDITNKIGTNIFTELNLIEKIKNINPSQRKLIDSVNFLGVASKQDKMINFEHCENLCQLLIQKDTRNSQLIDQKFSFLKNTHDKHFLMLSNFKKQINMKGDLIQIEGDHNKPRSNEVKQKISFFIQDSFYSFRDFQINEKQEVMDSKSPNLKGLNFSKIGLSIKTKLSFAKQNQNNSLKSRKDSQNLNLQNTEQEEPNKQNYNLINLKDIKAQQIKKSLSKEKGSIRSSLNKNFLFKQRKPAVQVTDNHRGLNIVSKQCQRQKNIYDQNQRIQKKGIQTLQNSTHKTYQNQERVIKPKLLSFENLNNKNKDIQNTPKYKQFNQNKYKMQILSNEFSNNSESVNNSINKQSNSKKSIQNSSNKRDIFVSALNLSQNQCNENNQNLTQRYIRQQRNFQNLPSQRTTRNIHSQNYINSNNLDNSPMMHTSPFNVSVDSKNNASFEMHNSFQEQSFRKRQANQILDVSGLSLKRQGPQTPQAKISISEFRNKNQQESNKKPYLGMRKQNNFKQENISTHNSTFQSGKVFQSQDSQLCEQKSNLNSLQFRKRQNIQKSSITHSDLSCSESMQFDNKLLNPHFNKRQRIMTAENQIYNNQVNNQRQGVSNSFCGNSEFSLKNMMVNNGHKGLTQSSTFNNGNNYVYNAILTDGIEHKNQQNISNNISNQHMNHQQTTNQHSINFTQQKPCVQKPLSCHPYQNNYNTPQTIHNSFQFSYKNQENNNRTGFYPSPNFHQPSYFQNNIQQTTFGAVSKSMKTSQQPQIDFNYRSREYPSGGVNNSLNSVNNSVGSNASRQNEHYTPINNGHPVQGNVTYTNSSRGAAINNNNNIFFNNNHNQSIGSISVSPFQQQPYQSNGYSYQNIDQSKKPIQYKKKITKLLD